MNLVLIYDYLKTEYGYLIRIGLYSFRFFMFIQCSICILVFFYNIFTFKVTSFTTFITNCLGFTLINRFFFLLYINIPQRCSLILYPISYF